MMMGYEAEKHVRDAVERQAGTAANALVLNLEAARLVLEMLAGYRTGFKNRLEVERRLESRVRRAREALRSAPQTASVVRARKLLDGRRTR